MRSNRFMTWANITYKLRARGASQLVTVGHGDINPNPWAPVLKPGFERILTTPVLNWGRRLGSRIAGGHTCCRFKNVMKSSLNADSGVTSTMAASSGGRRLSHSTHEMPATAHRCCKSWRKAINGTTTTVSPPLTHAGNMNNMLLPPPVGITTTTGLTPCWIACIAGPWTPRNWLWSSLVIRCNASVILASWSCHRR
ncbi:hypothetical protein N7510_008156 [Penicillium lagena]|uniref:uncharacterized protein n=1 Tax=Penicillium lagena TaxID=94218 RepID=UPI00253FFE1A|nr:uncharacterized protein N7510_008156 [Penicillium lagena]KAJ5605375.1 hypothetical protein N7510_008156 [Penicillium lagena]